VAFLKSAILMLGLAGVVCGQATTTLQLLDPLAVPAEGSVAGAVLTLTPPAHPPHRRCDVVIVGGGMGGSAAALAALRQHVSVCLTEPSHWLGGQMTAQGVSALDENRFSPTSGSSASYLALRNGIRAAYWAKQPGGAMPENFNPGACWVSRVCFEPRVALDVLDHMLAPYRDDHRLQLFLRTAPVRVERRATDGRLRSVLTYNFETHVWLALDGEEFIDATELGDLLPLANVKFTTGAESRAQTGEPDAPAQANPQATQSFTYPFILERSAQPDPPPGTSIPRPADYDALRSHYTLVVDYGRGKFLTYGMFADRPGTPGSFWKYRRLVQAAQYPRGVFPADLSMINWPGNDVCDQNLLAPDAHAQALALQHAKHVALGFAYWLQHDAPRDSGTGSGYPELQLVPQQLATPDGLAQFPYIREARRIHALRTVVEQDISDQFQHGVRGRRFPDSVGVALYAMDLHGCAHETVRAGTRPFQVPLGALIPREVPNLLAAAKNIGTTHITNGAFRLHPGEWAIGEAAGTAAVVALRHHLPLNAVEANPARLDEVQRRLLALGAPLFWYDDVTPRDTDFAAAQYAGLHAWLPLAPDTLHFDPLGAVTGAEAAQALALAGPGNAARRAAVAARLATQAAPLTWRDLAPLPTGTRRGVVRRGAWAMWLYAALPSPGGMEGLQ